MSDVSYEGPERRERAGGCKRCGEASSRRPVQLRGAGYQAQLAQLAPDRQGGYDDQRAALSPAGGARRAVQLREAAPPGQQPAAGGGVREALGAGASIVDVRPARAFAGGHIAGAKNIPLAELDGRSDEVGARDEPVVVYCQAGVLSAKASDKLQRAGFRRVVDAGAMKQVPAPQQAGGAEVQLRRADGEPAPGGSVQAIAASGVATSAVGLPHLERIQGAFGRHDVSTVQAHVGGQAGASAAAIGAEAFAMGEHVAFRGAPDLETSAHEAAHVVQQRAGARPEGGVGRPGDVYERHADAVAKRVAAAQPAEGLLDATPAAASGGAGAVQRMAASGGCGGGSPLLRWGSTGPCVERLQQDLNQTGASLTDDGHFGPLTHGAVIAFQQFTGLLIDGVVGSQTWGALAAAVGLPELPPGGKQPGGKEPGGGGKEPGGKQPGGGGKQPGGGGGGKQPGGGGAFATCKGGETGQLESNCVIQPGVSGKVAQIYFDNNEIALSPDDTLAIAMLTNGLYDWADKNLVTTDYSLPIMEQQPRVGVRLVGWADPRPTKTHGNNQNLAKKRVEAVKYKLEQYVGFLMHPMFRLYWHVDIDGYAAGVDEHDSGGRCDAQRLVEVFIDKPLSDKNKTPAPETQEAGKAKFWAVLGDPTVKFSAWERKRLNQIGHASDLRYIINDSRNRDIADTGETPEFTPGELEAHVSKNSFSFQREEFSEKMPNKDVGNTMRSMVEQMRLGMRIYFTGNKISMGGKAAQVRGWIQQQQSNPASVYFGF